MALEIAPKRSWIWTDLGVEPAQYADASYEGGVQPIAEFDNAWNRRISEDVDNLKAEVASHKERHQNGGPDEINLQNMSISDTGTLSKVAANRVGIYPGTSVTSSTPALIRWETTAGSQNVDRLAPVTANIRARGGVTVSEQPVDVTDQPIKAGATTVWDSVALEVPQPQLGGPAEHLTDYPLPNQDLANPRVTINTGTGMTGGGTVQLGESITLSSTATGLNESALRQWDFSDDGGIVEVGDAAYVWTGRVPAGNTVEVWAAALVANNLGPVPTGLDLVLGRGDPADTAGEQGYQRVSTIIAGDGTTRVAERSATGSTPLASWTNTLGSPVDAFIAVDNGDTQIGLASSGARRECKAQVIVKAPGGG